MRVLVLILALALGLGSGSGTYTSAFAIDSDPGPENLEGSDHSEVEPNHVEHFAGAPTPVVSGTLGVGQSLTVDPGPWNPAPDALSYQWLRSSTPIPGATDSSYVVAAEDVGFILSVTVTATKANFEVTERTSIASQPVEEEPAQLRLNAQAFGTSVRYTTPDWEASPPWANPTFNRPTPSINNLVLPGSIFQRDYWAHPNGYTVGRPDRPNHIVLHHTATTSLSGAISTLYGDDYAPTASYVVKDGELVRMVDERDSPWTNGRWTSNLYSVTFEMVNESRRANGTWAPPSASTRETTAWAMARAALNWNMQLPLQYGINVFGHRDVSKTPTACPGDLDVQAVVNRANEILGSRHFVTAAYQDVLGRSPEPAGLKYWMDRLAAGMPRGDMANAFNNSDEYRNIKIRDAYNRALKREPEPSGAAYWLQQLRRGALSPEDLYSTFLYTDEMFNVQGGGTSAGYVTALYRELLGRDPEPQGLAYWLRRLSTESRWIVSSGIWYSNEKYNVRVEEAFQTFLGRSADAGSLAYWSSFARAYGPTAMRSRLMASDEYWNRAYARFGSG